MVKFKRKRKGTVKKRRAMKVARVGMVKRMISRSEETKFLIAPSGAPLAITTAAPLFALMAPAVALGTGAGARSGQRITITRMHLRFACDANAALASRIRLMIIQDKQTDNAFPATAQEWFADKAAANSWFSGYDPDTVGPRFRILYDRSKNLNIGGGATDKPLRQMFSVKLKKRINVYFNATGTALISDINKNSILICAYTDAVATGPSLVFENTTWYKDA